jgi:hypothetical protein
LRKVVNALEITSFFHSKDRQFLIVKKRVIIENKTMLLKSKA